MVFSRFAAIAARHPQRSAILAPGDTWSYNRLGNAVDQVRHRLRALGGQPGEVIGLALSSPAWQVAGMLGVLAERCAYVILDPDPPPAWRQHVLATSGAKLILCDPRRQLDPTTVPLVPVHLVEERRPAAEWLEPRLGRTDDLAYLAFTSGSTGRPKAIAHTQANLLDEVDVHTTTLGIEPDDRFSALYGLHTVGANRDLFPALTNGAAYCPFPLRRVGMRALLHWLQDQRITILHAVPPLFRELMAQLRPDEHLDTARIIFLAGDRVTPGDVQLQRVHCPTARFYTGIGASETSSLYAHWFVPPDLELGAELPSGWPLPGRTIALLGEEGQPVVPGAIGAIAVSTDRLALGCVGGCHMTGDEGRIDDSGRLIFVGRRDHHVKIDGHRIDLGGIEARLRRFPGVHDAAVKLHPVGKHEQLVAYVAARAGVATEAVLRHWVAAELPAVAVPSRYVVLAALPLTGNGKVDLAKLPSLASVSANAIAGPAAPTADPLTDDIRALWNRALARLGPATDADSSFQALGGTSLCAMELAAAIQSRFGVLLGAEDFRTELTVARLVQRVRTGTTAGLTPPPGLSEREYQLLRGVTAYWCAELAAQPIGHGIGAELERRSERGFEERALLWFQSRVTGASRILLTDLAERERVFVLPSPYVHMPNDDGAERLAVYYAWLLPQLGCRRVRTIGTCHNGPFGQRVARHLAERGITVEHVFTVDPIRESGPFELFDAVGRARFLGRWRARLERWRHPASWRTGVRDVWALSRRWTQLTKRSATTAVHAVATSMPPQTETVFLSEQLNEHPLRTWERRWIHRHARVIRLHGVHGTMLGSELHQNRALLIETITRADASCRAAP